MAPVPVTTPTNGESDQLQAFEKIPTPVSEEASLEDSPTEEPAPNPAPSEDIPRVESYAEGVPTEDAWMIGMSYGASLP